MEKKEGGRRGSSVFIQIVFIALVFFLILTASQLLLLRKYYAVEVYGTSMEGTVQSGDIVYAEREFTLKRGEIVIVDVSQNPTFSSGGEHVKTVPCISRRRAENTSRSMSRISAARMKSHLNIRLRKGKFS